MCPEGLSVEWGWITTTSPFIGLKMSDFSTVSRWKPRRSSTGPQSFAWPGCLPFVGAPPAARARRTYLAHIPWLYLFALFRRCVVYFSISTGISMPARFCAAPDSSDKDGRREIGELVKQRAMPIYDACHTYSEVRWRRDSRPVQASRYWRFARPGVGWQRSSAVRAHKRQSATNSCHFHPLFASRQAEFANLLAWRTNRKPDRA